MDPTTLLPIISPLVTAAIAYLRDEAAAKAGAKAAEAVGTEAGKALAGLGPQVLTTLRSWFTTTRDPKAQHALANVEQDPDDGDYQQKLVKETARLAAAEPAFVQELRVLAEQVTIAQPGSVTIDNKAPNQGGQGVFHGPVTFNPKT